VNNFYNQNGLLPLRDGYAYDVTYLGDVVKDLLVNVGGYTALSDGCAVHGKSQKTRTLLLGLVTI
jgi:hypothetical protein